ncbi:hypothetical protein BS47DRAFT_315426 [Hydnum rufescens UP504]|uniref:Uncharacterized protein n=1 Tax=Hydnum rufescens UP504 TaxID=1448309 RepID=A0A9P6AK93_9AGAM|nr:hypothetical protein BS47DRAFT_315426 [Hydnum rufescens UP504]
MPLKPPTSTSSFFPPPIHLSHYARKQATPSASPSPSKRRRLSPSSTPSTVNSPAPSDVEALTSARYRSSMRVLSVWNSLETKYARDLADDDVVDIVTGRVIQDKGVLRQMPEGKWAIGCFAGVGEDESINTDPEDGNPDDEDDEDEDEDFEGWSRVDYQYPAAPPIMVAPSPTKSISSLAASMVQDDEEDLRAFMRAEEARRAREGDIDAHLDALSIPEEENDDDEEEEEEAVEGENGSELESDLGKEVEDESSDDELNLGTHLQYAAPPWHVLNPSGGEV